VTSEGLLTQIFVLTENAFDFTYLVSGPCEMSFTFDTPISDKIYSEGSSDEFIHSEASNSCSYVTLTYELYESVSLALPTWLIYDQATRTVTV